MRFGEWKRPHYFNGPGPCHDVMLPRELRQALSAGRWIILIKRMLCTLHCAHCSAINRVITFLAPSLISFYGLRRLVCL